MPPTNNQIPEGLDLRKDGTIFLHLCLDDEHPEATELLRLRRPKMRELRDLRQAEWEISDQVREWIDTNKKALADLEAEAEARPDDPGLAAQIRDESIRIARESTQLGEELRLPWAAQAIETLNGRTLDPDDLPPWMGKAQFPADLIKQWCESPTRRGGQ